MANMNKKTLTVRQQNKIAKEIYEMVYMWGRMSFKIDHTTPAYQSEIGRLLGNKCNGSHKVGATRMICYIRNCRLSHLPF